MLLEESKQVLHAALIERSLVQVENYPANKLGYY